MSNAQGEARTVNQFALVSYLPDPLSSFLDRLRIRLTPNSNPHAHVTVLPPRPFYGDLTELQTRLANYLSEREPFRVELGSIKVFPVSNVIYLSVERGESELRALNDELDRGDLEFKTPFPYHPHITIAQGIPPEAVEELRQNAENDWTGYSGERGFLVDNLWLVQNVVPDLWVECGDFPLALGAPVLG